MVFGSMEINERKGLHMKIKNRKDWELGLANNQDEYGKEIYRYAESWADLMEAEMEKFGVSVSDCAKNSSHKADTSAITGFMYGVAVAVLSNVWEHGEELRRWHNLDTQINNEGEEANESGGVLNPAILNIQV